jgi:hypothetical protein
MIGFEGFFNLNNTLFIPDRSSTSFILNSLGHVRNHSTARNNYATVLILLQFLLESFVPKNELKEYESNPIIEFSEGIEQSSIYNLLNAQDKKWAFYDI